MTDVTIPADQARALAAFLRAFVRSNLPDNPGQDAWAEPYRSWADLLDPKPPTLREKVAEAMRAEVETDDLRSWEQSADAVLAVIVDEADVLVLKHPGRGDLTAAQFVAWLRGEQS